MGKNALIVIDVQNYYINDHTNELPQKIFDFIKRNRFDFILFTQFVNRKDSNLIKVFNWDKMMSSPDIDIHKIFDKYIEKNNVFRKSTYSIFKSKKFTEFLKKNKITDLFFCGLDTDACILASAYEGFDLDYSVKVLENLTLSHCGTAFEGAAMKIINKNLQKRLR